MSMNLYISNFNLKEKHKLIGAFCSIILFIELTIIHLPTGGYEFLSKYSKNGTLFPILKELKKPLDNEKKKIAIIGDSQTVSGLDKYFLDRYLDNQFEILDLGLMGGTPVDYLYLLKNIQNKDIDLLIMSIAEGNMNNAPNPVYINDILFNIYIESDSLSKVIKSDSSVKKILREGTLGSFIPSYRIRNYLYNFATTYIQLVLQQKSLFPIDYPQYYDKYPITDYEKLKKIDKLKHSQGKYNNWARMQWWALEKLFKESGLSVKHTIFLYLPKLSGYEKILSNNVKSNYDIKVGRMCKQYNIDYLSINDFEDFSNNNFFYDFLHFTKDGRNRISKAIANIILENNTE